MEPANAMFEYIEIFYDCRHHSQHDYRSPIESEVASDKQLNHRLIFTPQRLTELEGKSTSQ